jgi:hypothetical protein
MSIGERIAAVYLPTPPAASGHLPDGAPFDAGTAMILHSNASHLAERNVRLIGHAPLAGEATLASTFSGPWGAAIDVAYDASADDPANGRMGTIPWAPGNAEMFGPLALAHTRLGTAPAGFYPRKVRVVVQCHKSAETFSGGTVDSRMILMAALTDGPDTPLRAGLYATAYAQRTAATSGDHVIVLDLDVAAPVRPSASWRSRASSSTAPSNTTITPAWVWCGWYSDTTLSPDRVESVSVFEVY